MPEQVQNHSVCIAGGGPAGLMAGYLLARTGIDVVVLEKHSDFLRDFRGDTVHPSTLEVLHELGLLEEFLLEPHQKVHQIAVALPGLAPVDQVDGPLGDRRIAVDHVVDLVVARGHLGHD